MGNDNVDQIQPKSKQHVETPKVSVLNRRNFLKIGLITAVASFSPCKLYASFEDYFGSKRSLSLYNTHTQERLKTVYWTEDKYLPDALASINHILRDHRNGQIMNIDTALLDILYRINLKMKYCKSFHIISGYRSPETNAYLRKRSRGVAKRSLHLTGQAADIRIPGCQLSYLRDISRNLKAGGVGYYPSSNFVHVDTGRVRYW
jgi:uncharacterized protein YcbK (DUF882 family)